MNNGVCHAKTLAARRSYFHFRAAASRCTPLRPPRLAFLYRIACSGEYLTLRPPSANCRAPWQATSARNAQVGKRGPSGGGHAWRTSWVGKKKKKKKKGRVDLGAREPLWAGWWVDETGEGGFAGDEDETACGDAARFLLRARGRWCRHWHRSLLSSFRFSLHHLRSSARHPHYFLVARSLACLWGAGDGVATSGAFDTGRLDDTAQLMVDHGRKFPTYPVALAY